MYCILFWIFVTSHRLYLNKYNYQCIDLYMSTIHSTISPLLYYNVLEYSNNLLYDFNKINYDNSYMNSMLLFSFMYFLCDTFIVEEIEYKIHHIVSLSAISTVLYYNINTMAACEYLFYAEYPVVLYNYLYYLKKKNVNITSPTYYKSLAILHWLMMVHSRVYNLGLFGYNCILYLDRNVCYYIIITSHFIIYLASLNWVIINGKKLLLDNNLT